MSAATIIRVDEKTQSGRKARSRATNRLTGKTMGGHSRRISMLALALFAVFAVAVLAVSSAALAASQPKTGDTLVIGTTSDPDTLNPLASNSVSAFWILNQIYPTLMVLNEGAEKVPYLATDWGYSDDGLIAWYKLRKDVTWQDGKPITSADVKFTAETIIKHQIGFNSSLLSEVTTIETPDPYTVRFKLKKSYGPFLNSVGFWVPIVPKHIWEKIDDPKRYPNEDPIGAGPFKLVSHKTGQYYELQAVDKWFNAPAGRPYLDKLLFKVYPDINTLILALKKGEVDVSAAPIPAASVADVKATPGITVVSGPSLGYRYLQFNIRSKTAKALSDLAVRQAFAYGVNKKAMNGFILRGTGMNIVTAVSPVLKFWYDPTVKDYDYAPAKAKEILDKGGYKDTNGDGVREVPAAKGGGKLSFSLLFNASDDSISKAAKMLKDDMAKIGIELTLDGRERNSFLSTLRALNYEVVVSGWGIMDEPADYLYLVFHSGTYGPDGINRGGINDPELDKLIEQAKQALDPKVARAKVFAIQERLHELEPEVELWVDRYSFAYRNDFTGYTLYPSDLRGIVDPQTLVRVRKVK